MKRREFLRLTGSAALTISVSIHGARIARAQDVPDDFMKLFLLIGQSNMAGRGHVEAQDEVTNPRIWMLTKDLKWTLAKDPVHFDKPEMAGVGLCSEFARTLVENDPHITVGLIPCAMGGTSLDEWHVGGPLYSNAIARTREAMKRGTLSGILWHQGEGDAGDAQIAAYPAKFSAFIAQLRADLGAEAVPLVIGELVRTRPASAPFNAALPAISAGVPRCALVSSEGLVDKGDHLHFDAASLRTLGARYAAAFLKLQAQTKTDKK